MLRILVMLWVYSLGITSVGFVALVTVQRVADLVRPWRRTAQPGARSVTPLPVRADQPRESAEALAG